MKIEMCWVRLCSIGGDCNGVVIVDSVAVDGDVDDGVDDDADVDDGSGDNSVDRAVVPPRAVVEGAVAVVVSPRMRRSTARNTERGRRGRGGMGFTRRQGGRGGQGVFI